MGCSGSKNPERDDEYQKDSGKGEDGAAGGDNESELEFRGFVQNVRTPPGKTLPKKTVSQDSIKMKKHKGLHIDTTDSDTNTYCPDTPRGDVVQGWLYRSAYLYRFKCP